MEPHLPRTKRCRLLELPAELRTKIYLALLGNHTIHIAGTGPRPFTEGHLPHGRSSSCVAQLTDPACYSKYTAQNRALKGTLPEDRFAKRHRDCHRYPVSHSLSLDILSTCKQIHSEASTIPFEENTFTLARPHSLPPFLERLRPFQMHAIRTIRLYSASSSSTWIGPFFTEYDFENYLTGLRRLEIFIEIDQFDMRPAATIDRPPELKWRVSGVEMFKLSGLREVVFWVVTPDWWEGEREELGERTRRGLEEGEASVRQMLLPLGPLQRVLGG